MQSFWKVVALLGCMSAGLVVGACDKAQTDAQAQGETLASSPSKAIESDMHSALTDLAKSKKTTYDKRFGNLSDEDKKSWVSMSQELMDVCGGPATLAQCLERSKKSSLSHSKADKKNNACKGCSRAGFYLARLLTEGFAESEIREHYALRFDPKQAKTIPSKHSPTKGSVMASVEIAEFSDFQCPYCRRARKGLMRVLKAFSGQVKVVFHHFPLSGHEHAFEAAKATEAAKLQGKFWKMHDVLFANQNKLTPRDIRAHAKSIGLNMAKFDADFKSKAVQAAVKRDRALGEQLKLQGTPAFFVNGRAFKHDLADLDDYIREELMR